MKTIFIPGTPKPQGSARAFVRGGRAIVTHANPDVVGWRDTIAAFVRDAIGPAIPHADGPVAVKLEFVMPRPTSEPKTRTRPHTRKPDLDKLVRGCLDAITGLVFTDDSQVVEIAAGKGTAEIGEQPGLWLAFDQAGAA